MDKAVHVYSRTRSVNMGFERFPTHFFSFSFSPPVLPLYATSWVMTDLKCLYNTRWGLALWHSFYPFLLCLAAISECDFWALPSWVYPSRFSPAWSFFCSYSNSLSLASSLPPIPVVLKNFNNRAIAFSSPSKPVNHLLLTWGYYLTLFSNSRTSLLLCFFHLWHRVYRCSTVCSATSHHQHLGVSITFILAKYVPTASCPTLSW